MSSTTNVQNLLVNVFRPVYTYDATTTLFTPKIELSNIDNYSGNTISVFTAAVGDSNNNVYVGSNAGNPFTTTKLCRNVTAIGYAAGSNISNVSNSTYLGFNAGAGALSASNVVAIGANTNGNGTSNVYVGTGAGGPGNSNVFLGSGTTGSGSGSILIGPGLTTASGSVFKLGQNYLTGNMTTKWLGIGTPTPIDPDYNALDVSGNLYVLGQEGINMIPVRTLDVNGNFRASDAFGSLDFNNGVTSSSSGFSSIRGSTVVGDTGNVSIGTLKNGLAMIAVRSGPTNFDGRTVYILDVDTPTVSNLSSNKSSTTTVNFTSNSINISNTTGGGLTYDWTITYFPLP
jgi:hypothetical protein